MNSLPERDWASRHQLLLFVLAVLGMVAMVLASRQRRADVTPVPPPGRFIDESGTIGPGSIQGESRFLDGIMLESGIDVRVRIVRSTHGEPLPAFALAMMREQGIGREVGGRGLLIVIDDSTNEARIEVAPQVEGVFPDGYVSYLRRENLSSATASVSRELALRTTLRMINRRTREARLGGEYDPRALRFAEDTRRLASDGGSSASIPDRGALANLLVDRTPAATAAYFAPQPSVREAYERELDFLALGLIGETVPLFTPNSAAVLATQPHSRGWSDYLLAGMYGYSYAIDSSGDLAMLYYTDTPFRSPIFFRRSAEGWQVDIAAEVRNSQEIVATYLTWRMLNSGDDYSLRFARDYRPVAGTRFKEFLRVRGGDNRTMCIYGEPDKPAGDRLHDSQCIGDSLPLPAANR